jgi:catechol 2,3-dioxygenase-like lactoylglutathione lyase family enzyme
MLRFDSVSPRLVVEDVMMTVRFYVDVLGLDDWSGWPEQTPTFAIVSRDGVTVQFQQLDAATPRTSETTMLHFTVADVHSVLNQIGKKVKVEWGPEVYSYGRREFAIRDCNGVMLIFSDATNDPPTNPDDD